MKKVVMLLITLIGFQLMFAQKGEPIRPYGYYSVEDTRVYALENREFRETLIPLVHRKLREAGYNIQLTTNQIFNYVQEQEVWLEARQFKNSRRMSSGEIDLYTSESRYEGAAGVFIYQDCSFPLYKVSCSNILDASLNGVTKIPHTVLVPEQIVNTVEIQDTIYKKVWVEVPQEREEVRVEIIYITEERYQPYYQEPIYMPLMIPTINFGFGNNYGHDNYRNERGGNYSTTNIDNSSYYYNNQVTNTTTTNTSNTHSNYNYSNNNNNYGSPTYPPTPDTGGPGGAGMNTNTGNGYGGPGGTGMNNNSNGYGGPGGTGTNGTGGPGGTGGGAGMNTNLGNNANQNSSTGTGMNTNTGRRGVASGNNQRVKSRDINPQARTSNEDGIYSSNRSNSRMESPAEVVNNEGSLFNKQASNGNNRQSSSNNKQASYVSNSQSKPSTSNRQASYGNNNRSSSSNNQARQSSNQQSRSSNGYGSNNRSSSSNRQASYGSNNRQANNSGYGSNNRSSSSNRQASSNGYGSNRRN